MRKLYVTTVPLFDSDKNLKTHLIGTLSDKDGTYVFEYKLAGQFHERFLKIADFPDAGGVYSGEQVQRFVYKIIPKRTSNHINLALKSAGLREYNEWALLKHFGPTTQLQNLRLCEVLPEGTIRYDAE